MRIISYFVARQVLLIQLSLSSLEILLKFDSVDWRGTQGQNFVLKFYISFIDSKKL